MNLLLNTVVLLLASSFVLAETSGKYLSCSSLDQTIKLRRETNFGNDKIELTVHGKSASTYTDGGVHRLVRFTNGETAIREFATGQTVLNLKQVPLEKSDRGSEQKYLLSQSKFITAPTYVQCNTIDPSRTSVVSFSKKKAKAVTQAELPR